jgi:hypothetical protein
MITTQNNTKSPTYSIAIATATSEKDPRKPLLFYIADVPSNNNTPKSYTLTPGLRFYPTPSLINNQTDFFIITGPKGVGKSTLAADIIQTYHTIGIKNYILISAKDKDDAFDNLGYITRIKDIKEYTGKLPNDPEEPPPKKKNKNNNNETATSTPKLPVKSISDFANSVFIFDDIEHHPEKKRVNEFKSFLVQTGRSSNIHVILCNHMAMNYKETREDLLESSHICVFPQNGSSAYHIRRYMKDYMGMKPDTIERIMSERNSRWVLLYKNHPNAILTSNKILLI